MLYYTFTSAMSSDGLIFIINYNIKVNEYEINPNVDIVLIYKSFLSIKL